MEVWFFAAIAAIIIVSVMIMRRQRPNTVARIDRETVELTPVVRAYVEAANAAESEDEPRYRDAVAALNADASQSVRLIAVAYDAAGADARPVLIMAANAMASSEALPFLARVATTDAAGVAHTLDRLSAINGLEILARKGEDEALAVLEQLAHSDNLAVHACAIAALKFAPGTTDHMRRLERDLKGSAREWLKVTRPSVREVAQITDPQRHLRRPGQPPVARPAPDGSAAASPPRSGARHAPRIRMRG